MSDIGPISGGYRELADLWIQAQATERQRVMPEEAQVNSEVVVDAPRAVVYKKMLRPDVMERYLFADRVDRVPGARGEDLGADFHCHHGGSEVSMRVVSLEKDRELTLISDQPTTMHITTRLSDAGDERTTITRSFLWEEPDDPDVAATIRQMMEGMAIAGEDAIKAALED
jgi:uncharacterized protein YndB with AHSA1/START domain